jgi:hypothetical protein
MAEQSGHCSQIKGAVGAHRGNSQSLVPGVKQESLRQKKSCGLLKSLSLDRRVRQSQEYIVHCVGWFSNIVNARRHWCYVYFRIGTTACRNKEWWIFSHLQLMVRTCVCRLGLRCLPSESLFRCFAPRTAIRLVFQWQNESTHLSIGLSFYSSYFEWGLLSFRNGTSWERTMNLCGLLVTHSSSGEFTEREIVPRARASWIKDCCWERTKRLLAREGIILFDDAMRVVPTFILLCGCCNKIAFGRHHLYFRVRCWMIVERIWFVECIYLSGGEHQNVNLAIVGHARRVHPILYIWPKQQHYIMLDYNK